MTDLGYDLIYARVQKLNSFVRSVAYNHSGWVVGSYAGYLLGLTENEPKDIDMLVPFYEWGNVSMMIPQGTPSNSFGGFKLKTPEISADIWCGDIGWFLCRSTSFNCLAVHLRTRTVLEANHLVLNRSDT